MGPSNPVARVSGFGSYRRKMNVREGKVTFNGRQDLGGIVSIGSALFHHSQTNRTHSQPFRFQGQTESTKGVGINQRCHEGVLECRFDERSRKIR